MTAHVGSRMSAYIDRELPPSERAGVEAHLRECAECARAVEEMRAVDVLARGQEVEAPPGYFEDLPGRLRGRLAPPARARVPAWTLALAAGLVVAVLAPIVMRERPAPQPEGRMNAERSAPAPVAPPATAATPEPAAEAPIPAARRIPPTFQAPQPSPTGQPSDRLAKRERADAPAPPAIQAPAGPPVEGGAYLIEEPPPAEASRAGERRVTRPIVQGRGVEPAAVSAGIAAPEADTAEAEEEEEDAPALVDDSATERDAAGRPAAPPPPPAAAAPARPGTEERFRALSTRAARSAAEARALRDAWQALVREDPQGPRADEARLRALEAGAAAWRLGRRREDRTQVERDALDYLRRPDGAHKERVRALVAGLEP
jgi:anti-sigma factor RsiW